MSAIDDNLKQLPKLKMIVTVTMIFSVQPSSPVIQPCMTFQHRSGTWNPSRRWPVSGKVMSEPRDVARRQHSLFAERRTAAALAARVLR